MSTKPTPLDALKARQGHGARYDAPGAPHDDLLEARRGMALFARQLGGLTDEALFDPSAIDGLSCARIVTSVSYAARRQAVLLDVLSGRSGADDHPLPDPALAETLPPHAIRHLFHHCKTHLNISWRDLSDVDWDRMIAGDIPVRALPRRFLGQVGLAAVDLGTGARVGDLAGLLQDDRGERKTLYFHKEESV